MGHKFYKYVVITPVRDEEEYLMNTISSMIKQTIIPEEWIIVNDGSKDRTGEIIDSISKRYEWIKPIHLKDRGFRKSGSGVIEAFYKGYDKMTSKDWHFIVKLDGDLSFEPGYFSDCFKQFTFNPKLGISGGMIYHRHGKSLILETQPNFHVRGATKIYRKNCWKDIGGLLEYPGWDTLDEVKANMLGWNTYSLKKLKLVHYRFTGTADGYWRSNIKYGVGSYICGYHPLYVLLKSFKKLFEKPFILTSIGYILGFAKGYIFSFSRVNDKELVTYLRKQQLRKIFLMKTIWR